jgi:hypothetical protein
VVFLELARISTVDDAKWKRNVVAGLESSEVMT